jgi:transcription antitermination factor NusG
MALDFGDLTTLPGEEMLVMPSADSEERWWCFHVRPRREKKLVEAGIERGGRVYLPLRRSVKKYERWQRETMVPYFSGYVFGCFSEFECYELLSTGHIANILKVHSQEDLLRDLQEIEKALQVSRELETFPYIKRGKKVKIVRGKFRGIEGIVSERRGRFRVVLSIDFIRKGMSIELDAEDVEPA